MAQTKPNRSEILAKAKETFRLPAGTPRLVVIDRDKLADAVAMRRRSYPVVVLDAETGKTAYFCFAVEINGPSRLVPASDSLYWCGEDHPNRIAVETEAEIACYELVG